MDPKQKRLHVSSLVRLAKYSGLYPECLRLDGVKMSDRPVAAGSFGDVYKGTLRGQAIAVKMVKLYEKSDVVRLLRVSSSTLHFFITGPS